MSISSRITHIYAKYLPNAPDTLTCAICKCIIDPTQWVNHILGLLHTGKLVQLQAIVAQQKQKQLQQQQQHLANPQQPSRPIQPPPQQQNLPKISTQTAFQSVSSITSLQNQTLLDDYSEDSDDNAEPITNPIQSSTTTQSSQQQPLTTSSNLTTAPQISSNNTHYEEEKATEDDDIDIDSIQIPSDWTGDPDEYIEQYLLNRKAHKMAYTSLKKSMTANFTIFPTLSNSSHNPATSLNSTQSSSIHNKGDQNDDDDDEDEDLQNNIDADGSLITEFIDEDGDLWHVTSTGDLILQTSNTRSTNSTIQAATTTTSQQHQHLQHLVTADSPSTASPTDNAQFYQTSYVPELDSTLHIVHLSPQNEDTGNSILNEMRRKRQLTKQNQPQSALATSIGLDRSSFSQKHPSTSISTGHHNSGNTHTGMIRHKPYDYHDSDVDVDDDDSENSESNDENDNSQTFSQQTKRRRFIKGPSDQDITTNEDDDDDVDSGHSDVDIVAAHGWS